MAKIGPLRGHGWPTQNDLSPIEARLRLAQILLLSNLEVIMFRSIGVLACVAMVAATATGCSVPDGDDMGEVVAAIDALPQDGRQKIVAHKDNDRLRKIVVEKRITLQFGCREWRDAQDRGEASPLWSIWFHDHLLQLLTSHPEWGLAELIEHARNAQSNQYGNRHGCSKWDTFSEESTRAQAELDADAESSSESEDSARWLIQLRRADIIGRPSLMTVIGVGLVGGTLVVLPMIPGVGGAFGLGLALCTQSTAIDCPQAPDGSGTEPSQPGQGGGDAR